jgi:hypothetical protein
MLYQEVLLPALPVRIGAQEKGPVEDVCNGYHFPVLMQIIHRKNILFPQGIGSGWGR